MTNGCVTRLRAVEKPALRLFLFHCAGGSHLLFRGWERAFPADWELCPVEWPGRGRLADRPCATDTDALAQVLLPAILPILDIPFAFFGHSAGGLVAYDLTLRLAAAGAKAPVWLGISARHAPDHVPPAAIPPMHSLPDAELRAAVIEMGGTPQAVLDDPKLWAIMAPVLRADLRLAYTWQRPAGTLVVAPKLSAFGATGDIFVPPEQLRAWARFTPRFLGPHLFPGRHFYFYDRLPELARHIVADLAA